MLNSYSCTTILLLMLSQMCVICMEPTGSRYEPGSQYELCSGRNTTYARPITEQRKIDADKKQQETVIKPCVFCDEKILKTNFIIDENVKTGVRVMLNKFPYFSFDQGAHILFMLIAHKEYPDDIDKEEYVRQVHAAQEVSGKLYNDAYSQEYFTNWGAIAGQSVPHWHSQLKHYNESPCSLPERVKNQEKPQIQNIEQAFEQIKKKLDNQKDMHTAPQARFTYTPFPQPEDIERCTCCSVQKTEGSDNDNLVVARFTHNYVCLSHYPRLPGELSVVPNRHVPAMHYLSKEELRENMILAKVLLPLMVAYAQEYIRDCSGGNIYTKSIGSKAPRDKQEAYHVHTTVMPRTVIAMTPGSIEGNSCKLDCNPAHLLSYLRERAEDLKKAVNS